LHIEFLVEEPSSEAFLNLMVPRIAPEDVSFTIHPHQGKHDLLRSLPNRLRGYARWLPPDWRIVVLVDRDQEPCEDLKIRLNQIADGCGLATKSAAAPGNPFQVLNRIAVEELEAWFFGDVDALRAVYPRVPATLHRKAKYRDPDSITGGTWESLERVLQRAGYHPGGLQKIKLASDVAQHMQPDRNRSTSFKIFLQGLRAMTGCP
jgi:Domain of unknown function (DUF4276)